VLLNAGLSRAKALLFNAISGMASVVGGVLGYFLIGSFEGVLPWLLVLASSSFIYISVADLLPQLQQRLAWRETLAQVAWLAVGLGVAFAVSKLLHGAH
jgi:zinc and cadmium transporter